MITFKKYLNEGINDKGIFKAVFVIGLPGAGKSYTIRQLRGAVSPKIVNTDRAAEFLASKWQKQINSDSWAEFKDKSHKITTDSLTQYLNGMLPLFVDGTSNDVSNILHRIGILESLGYDVGIAFVRTSLDTAIKRAEERAKQIGRHVDADFIKAVDARNLENARYLKEKVSFFRQIDNDTDELGDQQMADAFKATQQFFASPVQNPIGKRMIEELKSSGGKYLSPQIISLDVLDKKVQGWYKS